jgi:hypothetical protein
MAVAHMMMPGQRTVDALRALGSGDAVRILFVSSPRYQTLPALSWGTSAYVSSSGVRDVDAVVHLGR